MLASAFSKQQTRHLALHLSSLLHNTLDTVLIQSYITTEHCSSSTPSNPVFSSTSNSNTISISQPRHVVYTPSPPTGTQCQNPTNASRHPLGAVSQSVPLACRPGSEQDTHPGLRGRHGLKFESSGASTPDWIRTQ